MKEIEGSANTEKKLMNELLGRQVLAILKRANITSLNVESDGSISGIIENSWYPVTYYLKNIRLEVQKKDGEERIMIISDMRRYEDTGKII